MPPAGAVDLWVWPLDVPASQRERDALVLSAEERDRARRFAFPHLTARFVVAHGRMRALLGAALDRDPAGLEFVASAHGKPELAGGGIHFSLSHSGDLAALAIAAFPLGLDIEMIRPVDRALPERFFAPAERRGLRGLPPDVWDQAFFRCWTRKEAVIKALGLGLAFPLEDFDVSFLEGERPRLIRLAGEPAAERAWQLHHFDAADHCVGAIAAREVGWQVRRRS
jgi:4'-phosphopantetheinyl transferase